MKKRGRPLGVKNKPVLSFIEKIAAQEATIPPVDYESLCYKLQEALAKSYAESEELEKSITYLNGEISARDIVIRYLESRK